MALNVNRAVQDAFYRYKMPRLQAKVEGKGNGVKTVIPNMVEIARALGRPPTCKWSTVFYSANYIHFNSEAILKPFLHTYA